jgi:hypothetical protein
VSHTRVPGSSLKIFSTLPMATRTTLDMLFGEFGDSEKAMFDDAFDIGLLIIPASMFFYSFMMIVFLVILNFLLAIVVDAVRPSPHSPLSPFKQRCEQVANRPNRDFGWVTSSRGRFATPADSPRHECSPCRGLHVRRDSLAVVPVHHSPSP